MASSVSGDSGLPLPSQATQLRTAPEVQGILLRSVKKRPPSAMRGRAQVRLEAKHSTLGSPMLVPLLKHHTFNPCCQPLKKMKVWAGEMAQRLRALDVRPEVPSSIPSNHVVAHNHL